MVSAALYLESDLSHSDVKGRFKYTGTLSLRREGGYHKLHVKTRMILYRSFCYLSSDAEAFSDLLQIYGERSNLLGTAVADLFWS